MIKNLTLIIFTTFTLFVKAQTSITPLTQPFGRIDTADLKLTSCDFEKDANAMVLFDKATVYYDFSKVIMERHKRIKIFTDNAKEEANIHIPYYGVFHDEDITDIVAETINLNGKSIEYTIINKDLIYDKVIDKNKKEIIFAFPNVKAGSVIEFMYKFSTRIPYNYPDWYFQTSIPTRYSELDASFKNEYKLDVLKKTLKPLMKDTSAELVKEKYSGGNRHIWAMSDVKSQQAEPFSSYTEDYTQGILFRNFNKNGSWGRVSSDILNDEDFGDQLNKHLDKENEIIDKARTLNTDDQKISYIFNTVKTAMAWNKIDLWYTLDGVKKAWDKKTGNSTEINLILYHLLKSINIKASLIELRTKENGKLITGYPVLGQFNKAVVYVPVDTAQYYILDASDKSNSYYHIPMKLMGLDVLLLDPNDKKFRIFTLKRGTAMEAISINASINDEGKIKGKFQISSTGYGREKYVRAYNTLGENNYIEQLQRENNNLKLDSLKLENLDKDTLALNQNFEFKYNLAEPDGGYMYFNPNEFTGFHDNPFLSETRFSDIDFGGLYNYSMNGYYKVPPAFKINILPKSVSLRMPDNSIVFKRVAAEHDGLVIVRYTIDYKKAVFTKDEYPAIREFFKKMYEMLNEPIVLKKTS
jgi:hypothetical protein